MAASKSGVLTPGDWGLKQECQALHRQRQSLLFSVRKIHSMALSCAHNMELPGCASFHHLE
jgi:hypothetical protein